MTNNYNNNNNNNNNMNWQAAATQGLSMLGGFIGANNQHRRQKDLMGIQHQNQMNLNRQGHRLQMDMWKNTSYPAQLKMMKEAGLSPGLMYGGGPGASGTTGSQGGGSAVGGNAQAFKTMDLSNMLIASEIAKKNAETKNIETDTKKTGGVDTEEAEQRIANMKESKDYIRLQSDYQKILNANKQDEIDAFLKNIGQETSNLKQQFDLTDEQWGDLLKEQMGKALTAVENSNLLKSKVELTDAQEQEIWEKLEIAYNKLELEGLSVDASLKQADASMIKATVEEAMRPMELEVDKKKIMVNSMTNIITSIISGISSSASSFVGNYTKNNM
tara:strand:+ start:3698 stop:4687 length:990 start_codon:yes stop_codon:yes gene_type:complete